MRWHLFMTPLQYNIVRHNGGTFLASVVKTKVPLKADFTVIAYRAES